MHLTSNPGGWNGMGLVHPSARKATRITSEPLRSTNDFSYDSDQKAGLNYRVVGDAACFTDPMFPSSVHMMALTGGLNGATTIAASIKKNCTEEQAAKYHEQKIEHQDVCVMATETYQPAINMIKPVIQGKVDIRTSDKCRAKYQSVPAGPGYGNYKLATECEAKSFEL
ncbi:hypothetical protein BT69DRAFT_1372150 [Atractiella rhizophila]|nr:hypothetical protein BT69DRAFT_1372150 [Atractiella rhizophila]